MISLAQTAILLAAAVVAVSLFRFLRLSSILGYLAAGLVIGPWGLNPVSYTHLDVYKRQQRHGAPAGEAQTLCGQLRRQCAARRLRNSPLPGPRLSLIHI